MTNNGGSAFPGTQVDGGSDGIGKKDGVWHHPGMSLLDWFAGQALVGAMNGVTGIGQLSPQERKETLAPFAVILYDIAEAMVEESKRRQG